MATADLLVATRAEIAEGFRHWAKLVDDGADEPIQITVKDADKAAEALIASVRTSRSGPAEI